MPEKKQKEKMVDSVEPVAVSFALGEFLGVMLEMVADKYGMTGVPGEV
jgi:hypothetical protein